jgi:5'(3')-deoxyribonucleotidase
MDEVMADTLAEHLRRYNQTFDEDVTPGDLVGKGLWEVAPLDRQQQLRAFLDAEDFFEDLALMPGAQEVLKQLSVRFEVFIATQAMTVPNSLGPKYRWLQRHFPFIPPTHYVFCGNKSILRRKLQTISPPSRTRRQSNNLRRKWATAPKPKSRPRHGQPQS